MIPPQGAGPASWPAPAVHDTLAEIARQPAYDRAVGHTVWQDFWNAVGRALYAIFEFFRGSAAGRNITLLVVALIVAAVIIHFVLAALAARNNAAAAGARPARERNADAWREAESLAAAGQYTGAAHALLAALLAGFAQRGEVRLHASKTAGDYARELARRASPSRAAFQQFRRRYDGVIFGSGTCDAAGYAALLRDAEPILSRGGAA